MWKPAASLALVLVLLGALALGERARPRADYVFNNSGDINTLDIHRMSWMKDLRIAGAVLEGLVAMDVFSAGLEIRPAAAERWAVSADRRTYTFHLRENAKWSNGRPVVAEDFRRTWLRGSLPDIGPDYLNLFELIKGVKGFAQRREAAVKRFGAERRLTGEARAAAAGALWEACKADWAANVGVRVKDERTLEVELERPTPYFLQVLAFEVLSPLYMDVVERYQRVDAESGRVILESGWTKPPNLVGNGPFELVGWRFKRDLRLERNRHYWNPGGINVDSIDVPAADDPNAQVLSFMSGGVDWVADVSVDYKRDLLARKRAYMSEHTALYERLKGEGLDPVAIDRRMPPDPRQNVHAFPAFGTYFFNFMCRATLPDGRANPFADARVRRAFVMAVDRQAVSDIRGIDERPTGTLIPAGSIPGYRSPRGVGFDPAGARALLAGAGHAGGEGLPTIEVLINKDGGHDLVAQSMARDWRRELGVEVVLAIKEIKVFREDLRNHNFMVSRSGWFGDYTDPTTFLDVNRTGDGNNDRLYSNPRFDALLDAANNEVDVDKRMRILEEAEALLVNEDCPIIPLVQYSQLFLFNPHRISGISPHIRQKQVVELVDVLGDGKGAERALEIAPASGGW